MNFTKIVQSIGLAAAVVGVAGFPGAIEFGTGYFTASVLAIGGAVILYKFR